MANYRLTPDEAAQLQSMDASIAEIQAAIDQYKRAGLNAAVLQANLNQVKSLRAGMLKHLAPGVTPTRP